MKTIWVLVADEAIARILQWPQEGNTLEPVEELTDPDAHASGSELRRDAQGRRAGSASGAQRQGHHRLTPTANVTASAGEDESHQEAERFAGQVVEHLTEALHQHRYDELRIAAAPRFLGLLRKNMSDEVARTVTDEIDKDLIHMQNREITERLFPRPPSRL